MSVRSETFIEEDEEDDYAIVEDDMEEYDAGENEDDNQNIQTLDVDRVSNFRDPWYSERTEDEVDYEED